MPTLDWEEILEKYGTFGRLRADARKALVSSHSGGEKSFPQGETILREGQVGDSIFIIGEGAVDVVLRRPDQENVTLYTLGEGEIFGEMALLEQRPRSATVVAAKDTTLLEIPGEDFRRLMEKQHDLALYVLAKLSQRLRYTDDKILDSRIWRLDETIGELRSEVRTVSESSRAHLEAADKMFEQTKLRANEIIESADRARHRVYWLATTAAVIIGLVGSVGGVLFTGMFQDVRDYRKDVAADRQQVESDRDQVEDDSNKVAADLEKVADDREAVAELLNEAKADLGLMKETAKEVDELRVDLNKLEERITDVYHTSILDLWNMRLDGHLERLEGAAKGELSKESDYSPNLDLEAEYYASIVSFGSKDNMNKLLDFAHRSIILHDVSIPIDQFLEISGKDIEDMYDGFDAVVFSYYLILLQAIDDDDIQIFNEYHRKLTKYTENYEDTGEEALDRTTIFSEAMREETLFLFKDKHGDDAAAKQKHAQLERLLDRLVALEESSQ